VGVWQQKFALHVVMSVNQRAPQVATLFWKFFSGASSSYQGFSIRSGGHRPERQVAPNVKAR
jgi:hypothetical protein